MAKTGNRHTGFHAAGQGVRISVGKRTEADFLQVITRALQGLRALQGARSQQWKHDVLDHGFPRWQLVEFLKHHDAIRTGLGDLIARQTNLAFAGLNEPRYRFEQRRLAAAGRAEQNETVRRIDLETDLVRCSHNALWRAVFEADAANLQQGFLRLGARAGRVALRDSIHERLS